MRLLLSVFWLWPLGALAAPEYAKEWPLTLTDASAQAFEVTFDDALYRTVFDPGLGDIEVFDARGESVGAAVVEPRPDVVPGARFDLPWFPLPASVRDADDLGVIAERDARGRVRRIETTVETVPRPVSGGWLVDASAVDEPVHSLEIDWAPVDAPFEEAVRIEGSDDLRRWRVLDASAPLLSLGTAADGLEVRSITLDARVRYLRIVPLAVPSRLSVTGVRAVLGRAFAEEAWAWVALEAKRSVEGRTTFFDFAVPGRFPFERVDVEVAGNSAIAWSLESRDGDDDVWQTRVGRWVAYRLEGEGASDRSGAQAFPGPVRHRRWRLSTQTPPQTEPTLRLGYRPESLVFVAEGQAPYRLRAGSATARRANAPVQTLIQAMKEKRGSAWRPAPALLGEPVTLAGERALSIPPDRQSALLWGVLVVGAALVAAFSLSLLRGREKADERAGD